MTGLSIRSGYKKSGCKNLVVISTRSGGHKVGFHCIFKLILNNILEVKTDTDLLLQDCPAL